MSIQPLLEGIYWSLRGHVRKADELLRDAHSDVLTTAAFSNTPDAAVWVIAVVSLDAAVEALDQLMDRVSRVNGQHQKEFRA